MKIEEHQRVGQLIRSNHRYAFRSGQWGRIVEILTVGGRSCYKIVWNEGYFSDEVVALDLWVVDDESAQYEFAQVIS